MPNQRLQAPFLDVRSFVTEELPLTQEALTATTSPISPFLAVYKVDEAGGFIDPEGEEYVQFLNELYDEEFDQALFELVNEAASIYDACFSHEQADPRTIGYQAERLLTQHFVALETETRSLIDTLIQKIGQRDLYHLPEEEIETLVDGYRPTVELSPSFENFFGKVLQAKRTILTGITTLTYFPSNSAEVVFTALPTPSAVACDLIFTSRHPPNNSPVYSGGVYV